MYCEDHSVRTRTRPAGDTAEQRGLAREEPARTKCLFIPTKAFRLMWSFLSLFHFSSVAQSVMSHSLQPHGLQHTRLPITSPSPTPSLLKLTSIESVMTSNPLIFCRPLLLLASIFPSIGVFSNESALHIRWPKYWS